MTQITVLRDKDGSLELRAKGHAGYAEHGKDIVCASVSVLICTLIESIDENALSSPPAVILESGKAVVRVTPKNENKGKICAVFDVICNGFKLLQEKYPKNVKFVLREG